MCLHTHASVTRELRGSSVLTVSYVITTVMSVTLDFLQLVIKLFQLLPLVCGTVHHFGIFPPCFNNLSKDLLFQAFLLLTVVM